MRQVINVVGLNRILVERAAAASSDAQVLGSLESGRSDWQAVHFGPETVDDVRRRSLAHTAPGCGLFALGPKRLQRDEHEACVTAAGVGEYMGHGGICLHNVY